MRNIVDCDTQVPIAASNQPPNHHLPLVPRHDQVEQSTGLLGRQTVTGEVGVRAHISDGSAKLSTAESAAPTVRAESLQQDESCLQNEPGDHKTDQDASTTIGQEMQSGRSKAASPGPDAEVLGTAEAVNAQDNPEDCPSSLAVEADADSQSNNEEESNHEPGITRQELPQTQEAEECIPVDRARDTASEAYDTDEADEPPHKRRKVRPGFSNDKSPGEGRTSCATIMLTPAPSEGAGGEGGGSDNGTGDPFASFDEWRVDATVRRAIIGGVETRLIQIDLKQCMGPPEEKCRCHEESKYQRKSIVANRQGRGHKRRDERKGRRCGICKERGHNARTCTA